MVLVRINDDIATFMHNITINLSYENNTEI